MAKNTHRGFMNAVREEHDETMSNSKEAAGSQSSTGSQPVTQPSQAHILPTRVRNAQALRDERAYIKAQANGASTTEVFRLRRKALPSVPCLDCGRRMKCMACDKEELLEELMEDYVNPPPKFEKGTQADVVAELAAESAEQGDNGPSQEEILTQQLQESQAREEFLRKRIKKKEDEKDELQRVCDFQTEELRVRTQERDDFEEEMIKQRDWRIKVEGDLAALRVSKDAMAQEYEEKLVQKGKEVEEIHKKRCEQNYRMLRWMSKAAADHDKQAILHEWWWKLQKRLIIRDWEAVVREKEEEIVRKLKVQEEKLEEEHKQYVSALERETKEKQQEFETVLAARDAKISTLSEDLSTAKDELQEAHETFEETKCQIEKERELLFAKFDQVNEELSTVKQKVDDQEKAAIEEAERKEHEMEEANLSMGEFFSSSMSSLPQIGTPSLDPSSAAGQAALARIKELEEELRKAEGEYNVVSAFLDTCQQKVRHLRRRLHAEVQLHLDSQAKYHHLTNEKLELEFKLLAQRRCMKRQRIPKPEVQVRAFMMKNNKLRRQIDKLRDRLGAVKNIAGHCNKNVRCAIMKAAGSDDVKARRSRFLESLTLAEPGCGDSRAF